MAADRIGAGPIDTEQHGNTAPMIVMVTDWPVRSVREAAIELVCGFGARHRGVGRGGGCDWPKARAEHDQVVRFARGGLRAFGDRRCSMEGAAMDVSGSVRAKARMANGPWPRRRRTATLLAATAVAATLLGSPVGLHAASADQCPDIEVAFARGTGEPPGVGAVGQAFVDSLGSRVGSRSVGVYPVDYPASGDFADRVALANNVIDGIRDESNHVETLAANCPATRIVLGGYSQGAAVTGFVTSAAAPPETSALATPPPMPPKIADHVAAIALFGTPSGPFLQSYGAPAIVIGPRYAPKTTELCNPGDTICDGTPGGGPTVAHALYAANGSVDQAADFAASHL